ncbi:hypothetical protein MKW92_013943 [Papaver armeniacum]|nr:hypothetical protein MKW92_013943 [Papaver armeniacum]
MGLIYCEKSIIEQQQQRKPSERRHKKKSLTTMSTDQGQVPSSTTIIEEKDHSEESPINFNQPTVEGRVAEKLRGSVLNYTEVAKLSSYGVEFHLIPTRSHWLEMVRDEWGTTDEEIKASIKAVGLRHVFKIEVCGWHKGYGVIVRDNMRNPIVVISKAINSYVSTFYHELQGVSLGLKLAMKYKIIRFDLNCISEGVSEYVMHTWGTKYDCGCPPRDNPKNPRKKKYYCVKCSKSTLDEVAVRKNADKIIPLVDEIFYDALEFAREGYRNLYVFPTKLSSAKAVRRLANSGIDQELRIHEIAKDEEMAEILYKEVYGHQSEQEIQQQLMLRKQKQKLQKQQNLAAKRA